jgi:peptide/nickel transport system substrate-binding protein
MTWRQSYILANANTVTELAPLPRHWLGDLYERGEKQAFMNSLYWTREFVGVGPYRMADWVSGSHLEGAATDDYFLGRAKIDRIVFRFFTAVPPLVAALMAGEVDMIPVGVMRVEQLHDIKRAWEPTNGGTVLNSPSGLRVLYLQYRDATAPWVSDPRARRALAHVIDRQTMVDTLQLGPVGHTLPTPDDPVHGLLESRGLAKYPYDPTLAHRLLAESGWTRPSGGVYQNVGGQRFSVEVRTAPGGKRETEQEALAVSDQFKAAGLESPVTFVQSSTADPSARAKAEGVFLTALDDAPEALSRFISSQIQTEENGWRGQNVWGYSSPVFDRLYDQYIGTMEVGRRQSLLVDMLKMAADDLIFLPLYYELGSTNVAFRKGVRGPGPNKGIQQANNWNIHVWEVD